MTDRPIIDIDVHDVEALMVVTFFTLVFVAIVMVINAL